ncbi:DUF924 family protein [Chromobacterium vaccinii]|uniref:DUF924 family protein n=1 Tax=Chromobacterium vaccinii TaxID=1108595 RepID=UPI0009E1A6C2|nr:DUF924 family protein [Chromobacterium vaccinii]
MPPAGINQIRRHHLHQLSPLQVSGHIEARRLDQPWLRHTEGHRDIIRRFGRFPHCNRIPGRPSTPEETAFLRDGGFALLASPARRLKKKWIRIADCAHNPEISASSAFHRPSRAPRLSPRRPVIPVL